MNLVFYSHRHADAIIESNAYLKEKYDEFIDVLRNITEDEIKQDYEMRRRQHQTSGTAFKSVTASINELIRNRMSQIRGWQCEVDIFNDDKALITNTAWRLDFACEDGFAIEVAFNHGEAIAWNLLKPVLASELNHVKKAIQTQIGIYVCATDAMKKDGNIDGSSGSYEKVIRYLMPMMNQLTVPMMIIGIDAPETFYIDKKTKEIREKKNENN